VSQFYIVCPCDEINVRNNNYALRINVTVFIFVISLSDVIQFCQFLAETCPREFEISKYTQHTTSQFQCVRRGILWRDGQVTQLDQ